ncbi:glycosyltransferase [Paenibacillus filicis]|uniref:Glycosyltransferase n=1 Tax=Paenibacillus gyeongsangnamensis TaxID=3388067 RepID=A0ABT4QHV7_9BACL|nr:glycosyltransferase [Paenibacillus filicis]MCZ8516466.1 glycosyltransferase [Paenibacillus filicis]
MKTMRVAIVHDYLNQMGGAERVVAVLHELFPEAPIYTTIVDREKLFPELKDADIRTTWMQHIPGIFKRFKQFFWLYPFAVRSMDLSGYDLVISSSSAYAKGVKTGKEATHVCYCYTPMRFAWDFNTYMEGIQVPGTVKKVAKAMVAPLRSWDVATARGVHHFVAISSVVQSRIKDFYSRPSSVIYPPVNISRFSLADVSEVQDYYLVVSRLVSYKKLDLAVQACSRLGKKLIVIGDGPDRERLQSMSGPSVEFKGRLHDEEVVRYMKQCRAFLFPGLEDFGITPLEVNACGRPVVAFHGGGALDTIVPGLNGFHFEEHTVESLAAALERVEKHAWDSQRIRRHAEQFDEKRFRHELLSFIQNATQQHPALKQSLAAVADQ